MLQPLWNWLRRSRAPRTTSRRRPATVRPTLEALEDRRLLSSSGLIAATNNADRPVVFAIRADRTLWEYDTNFGTPDHWMQVSPGAFESISAPPSDMAGTPVVYALLAGNHSLWENDPDFNPNATSLNGQWRQVSPAGFDSVSATFRLVNGQPEPVVYGIVSGDHSLWVNENSPDSDPSGASLNGYWRQVSPGAFTAVGAAFHSSISHSPRLSHTFVDPVAFAVVAGDHSVWENNPQFNPGASDLNAQWRQVAAAAYTTVSGGEVAFFNNLILTSEQLPVVYGIRQADQSLWQAGGDAGEVQISAAPWQTVSADFPTSISATDGSLWFTGPNNAIAQISPGTFRAVSPDGRFSTGGIVFAEPTDHSLWEYSPADFNPQSTNPNDHWQLLSPAGSVL